jgi:hypothetical protein
MSFARYPVPARRPTRVTGRAVHRGVQPLGFIAAASAAVSAASLLEKGVSGIWSGLENIFDPGAHTDAVRLARANFFRDAAEAGSVTAGRYILGGLQNVAGNEKPYYTAAQAAVLASAEPGPTVMQEAALQGAKWNRNDVAGDPNKSAMITDVQTDLRTIAASVPSPVSAPTSTGTTLTTAGTSSVTGVHTLPGMTTTAPFNWAPYAISGGIALAAVLFSRKH